MIFLARFEIAFISQHFLIAITLIRPKNMLFNHKKMKRFMILKYFITRKFLTNSTTHINNKHASYHK